jgi:FMN phosphatase YigB (HAD superfamily)
MQLTVRGAVDEDVRPERIVSVGDGVWDVAAASQLQWRSSASTPEPRRRACVSMGRRPSLADFTDLAAVRTALDLAEPPSRLKYEA